MFALFRVFQGGGAVIGFVVAILVQNSPLYVFILIVAGFQIFTNIHMNTFKLKNEIGVVQTEIVSFIAYP